MFNKTELQIIDSTAKTLVGYEHARLVRFDETPPSELYTTERLAAEKATGTLTSVFRGADGKLCYRMQPLCHTLIVGASGSGKSTGYIAHQLMATAFAGEASMVVVDSKGVLYETYGAYLTKLGYKVRLLNMQRSGWQHSEGFNPFAEAAETYRTKMQDFGRGVKVVKTAKGEKYRYKGVDYADVDALERAFRLEKQEIDDEAMSEIDVLVNDLWPVENQKDPYWERSGRSMYSAVLFALAEDMFPIGMPQTSPDMVNLRNMKNIIATFNIEQSSADDNEKDNGFLSGRGQNNVGYNKVRLNCFRNAGNTVKNILGVMREGISRYDLQSIQAVSLKTTVDPKWLTEGKSVLFLSYDETNEIEQRFLNFILSGLMKRLKNVADATKGKTLPRPVMFIIDEFATMPQNRFVPAFIGYGRSRNVFLSLVLQSYAQLMARYGDAEGKIILDNTNVKIYLATNDFNTTRTFSESLGRQTIVSPEALITGNIAFVERPLVTCSDLSGLRQGDCYVQSMTEDPLFGHFEPSYICAEYDCKRIDISAYRSVLATESAGCVYDVEQMLALRKKLQDLEVLGGTNDYSDFDF